MSKDLEAALWQMYADNITQGRHHEAQRTAVQPASSDLSLSIRP
jgi:hypothetical protein